MRLSFFAPAVALLALTTLARAEDPAPPAAPPPHDAVLEHHHSEMKMEKAAFLGVSVSPADAVLRHQLKLEDGTGLVVDVVAPGSPAERAGLKEFDVLQKMDDQILVNPEQLAVLVRTRKPNDSVKLSVVRDGQPQTIGAKLGEKELPRLDRMKFMDEGPFIRHLWIDDGVRPMVRHDRPSSAPSDPPGHHEDGPNSEK